MRLTCLRVLLPLSLFAFDVSVPAQAPQPAGLHLIPMPRQVAPRGDLSLTNGISIHCEGCDADDQFAATDLEQTLTERGVPVSANGLKIELRRARREEATQFTAPMQAEGYVIRTEPGKVSAYAMTAAGVFYAAQTLKQMIDRTLDGHLVFHGADVEDYPVLRYRGLSDDLSRGPVDTLAYQKKLVRLLASYKDNVYSPYFEHTQQYASNPLAAPPGGSISAEDARELVAYAHQFHIMVIPDQEAFGHLHHNLNWEMYSQLAETPHGAVLAPGQPGSLHLINQMFTELAQLYPSPFLHIGADETVDLGHGQTKAAVDAQGLAPVYLKYLEQVDKTLRPLNRRLLFWGDIAQDSPDLLKSLPEDFKHNTIAVAWWYNPRPQGFAKYITPFTNAGIETWIASGINNWSRVYPNWNMGLANIQQFTADGVKLGATGQLNTIWYDDGESLAANNPFGILFGAAQAWQGGTGSVAQFESAFGPVFHGDQTGKLNQAQQEIMAAQSILKDQAKVGDASDGLFWLDPWSKDGQTYAAKLRPFLPEVRLHAERALTLIAEARAAYPATTRASVSSHPHQRDGITDEPLTQDPFPATSLRETDAIDALELGARRIDFTGLKFQLCDEIPGLYARSQADAASTDKKARANVFWDLSTIRGVNGRLEDMVDHYSLLRDMYGDLWLRTNRVYGLRPVLEHYDYTIGLWYSRIDRFRSAERQFDDTKTLPSPAELGIPTATGPGSMAR